MEISKELQIVIDTLNKTVVGNIVIYDMKTVTPFYDYTIVASCNTARQGHATVDYLRDLAKDGFNVRGYSAEPDDAIIEVAIEAMKAALSGEVEKKPEDGTENAE